MFGEEAGDVVGMGGLEEGEGGNEDEEEEVEPPHCG